jgi:ATPases involved in chromosome partitioning
VNLVGKVISFGIQKGGCGKTTCTGMTSYLLAKRGYKVLAVDFDSQGNLTQFLTQKDPYDFVHKTAFEACKERDPRPYIYQISEKLHILPAEDFLSKLGSWIYTEYVDILRKEGNKDKYAPSKLLKRTLDVVKDDYDFILIDMPPNLGEQTINGMGASDYAVVILQSEPFCKSALERYLETLEHSVEYVNNDTRLLGIVTAMIDARYSMSQFILSQTREEYGELVFDTTIRRRARILEYSFEGIKDDTTVADREAQEMYNNLIDEMLERMGVQ